MNLFIHLSATSNIDGGFWFGITKLNKTFINNFNIFQIYQPWRMGFHHTISPYVFRMEFIMKHMGNYGDIYYIYIVDIR